MTNLEVKRGDDFYEKWRLKAEIKMKSKSIDNIEKRCNEVTKIVNEIGRRWCKNNIKCELFVINESWRNDINGSMILKLNHWSGVDVKACKNQINTWQEYWDRADNWFNRNKGQWFGDYLFYPLFENKLISYAKMVANIVNKECKILKDLIFIEILHKISNEHIRFKQTRSQSLLIDQSLVQSYKLRNLFITIAKLNNIEWEIPGIKKSARLYRETWRHCVAKIYNFKLKQYQHFIGNKKSVNNNNNINIKRSNIENKNIINNIPMYNISPIKPLNYILPIYRPPTTFIYTCTPMIRNNNIPSNNNNIIITSNNNNNNNNIINNITNNNNNNPLNNLPLYNIVSIPYGPITSQSIPNYSSQYRYSPY